MEDLHLQPPATGPTRTAGIIVAERRDSLYRSRREITVALERRRRELERALHDGAQQQLLALRMGILHLAGPRTGGGPGVRGNQAARPDAGLVARLDGVLEDLERLASGERPRALDAGNLVDAVRELAAISGASVVVHVPPAIVLDEASAELCAFVVSEALANAQQHSNASRCEVHVVPILDGLRVDVIDNGRGGATVVAGRGLDGLARRAQALDGTIEVFSDSSGTLLRLQLPLPKHPRQQPAAPVGELDSEPSMDALREQLDGGGVWFWCDDGAGSAGEVEGVWRDERGRPRDDAAIGGHPASRLVRLIVGGRPLALLATHIGRARCTAICQTHLSLLVDGREQAIAAPALERLRDENDRITRRARSFEEALRRRLTDRPRDELVAARACLTSGGGERLLRAAEHVSNATDLLREIVRRLRIPDDGEHASASLTTALERVARRARVRLDVAADDLDDERVSTLIERVAEEVMLDAPPQSELTVRVRGRRNVTTLSMLLERLPSPVAIALLEELALASQSTVSFQPNADGVRLVLEAPCAS